jgi:hypothetical protein
MTGFINPPANMLNYGLGMAVPMPTHIHFNDDGLPKTGPIPAILHGQYNHSILSPHHNTGKIIIDTTISPVCFPL